MKTNDLKDEVKKVNKTTKSKKEGNGKKNNTKKTNNQNGKKKTTNKKVTKTVDVENKKENKNIKSEKKEEVKVAIKEQEKEIKEVIKPHEEEKKDVLKKENENNLEVKRSKMFIIFASLSFAILIYILFSVFSNPKDRKYSEDDAKKYCDSAICNDDLTICYAYEIEDGEDTIVWKGDCSKIKKKN